MLDKVTLLLGKHGYEAYGAQTNEDAIKKFEYIQPQAVIIGGGVDYNSRVLLKAAFKKSNPAVRILDAQPQTVLTDLENLISES